MKRCSIATMPPFTRDPASPRPLQRQVYDLLRRAIVNGDLEPGSNLPSTRSLAGQWGVCRNTILIAYEELALEGLIYGRVGSGTRVRGRARVPGLPDPRVILCESHYPVRSVPLRDPDGNLLYFHTLT